MRPYHLPLLSLVWLTEGCVTMSGNYRMPAIDANGVELIKGIFVQERMIDTMRNAICSQYRNATVIITDMQTGQPWSSESPYKCL